MPNNKRIYQAVSDEMHLKTQQADTQIPTITTMLLYISCILGFNEYCWGCCLLFFVLFLCNFLFYLCFSTFSYDITVNEKASVYFSVTLFVFPVYLIRMKYCFFIQHNMQHIRCFINLIFEVSQNRNKAFIVFQSIIQSSLFRQHGPWTGKRAYISVSFIFYHSI